MCDNAALHCGCTDVQKSLFSIYNTIIRKADSRHKIITIALPNPYIQLLHTSRCHFLHYCLDAFSSKYEAVITA